MSRMGIYKTRSSSWDSQTYYLWTISCLQKSNKRLIELMLDTQITKNRKEFPKRDSNSVPRAQKGKGSHARTVPNHGFVVIQLLPWKMQRKLIISTLGALLWLWLPHVKLRMEGARLASAFPLGAGRGMYRSVQVRLDIDIPWTPACAGSDSLRIKVECMMVRPEQLTLAFVDL